MVRLVLIRLDLNLKTAVYRTVFTYHLQHKTSIRLKASLVAGWTWIGYLIMSLLSCTMPSRLASADSLQGI